MRNVSNTFLTVIKILISNRSPNLAKLQMILIYYKYNASQISSPKYKNPYKSNKYNMYFYCLAIDSTQI